MSDQELLEQYTRTRSREGLEELIRRHAPWVHAVATRRVGDEHLAQDVMQAVFLVLAQKPPKITSQSGLAGWLFGVTCNASSQAIRSEHRRRRRERAFAMEHQEATSGGDMSQKEWETFAPHLDLAVQSLADEDRTAVLLRFYQQKSHADVAAALGVSEEAARKRVSRAVAKLREAMARRGVAVPAIAALVAELELNAVPLVSAAIVQSALAVVSGAAASQAAVIAKGVVMMSMWSKVKVAAFACVVMMTLGAGTGLVVHYVNAQSQPNPVAKAQPAAVPAPGGNSFVQAPNPPAPADPGWRARFEAAYNLKDGEVLKHIPPPFIPERMDWYRTNDASQAQAIPRGPEFMTLNFDGKLRGWGMGFGYRDGQKLSELLGNTLRMKTFEFEGPTDLLSYRLKGDFVVRSTAPQAELLNALCQLTRADGGPAIRFSQQKLDRPVIVASGKYEFHPLKDAKNQQDVCLYVDKLDPDGRGGGGSGSVREFLQALGSRVGVAVVDEVTNKDANPVIWNHQQSSRLSEEPPGAARDEKLRKLLDAVAQQTSLQFKIETRPVEVWVAEPGNANEGL